MRVLNGKQREQFYVKRQIASMNFNEVAVVLNSTKEHMVSAQIGKEVPDEVYKAVTQWIGEG